jgi:hypothetical protein
MNGVTKYKFFGGLVLIVFLGFGVYYGVKFYRDRTDLKSLADYNDYLEQFKNDNIGGKTPEETLKMFVAALKKGDVELASQYFALDENGSRQKWVEPLLEDKNEGKLQEVIDAFSSAQISNVSDGKTVAYKVLNNEGVVSLFIELGFNGQVWKIIRL